MEKKENNGLLLIPSKKELDLLNYAEVNNWFTLNKPSVVILAAAKVGVFRQIIKGLEIYT